MSDGWWSLIRPLSSHLTTASSSLACSTVPNSPVGFPKSPKPSTRSPGFSSWSVAGGSASGGLWARSESAVAPGYDRGGCGALCSLGIGLLVRSVIFHCFLPRGQRSALTLRLFDRHSIGLERWFGCSNLHSSDNGRRYLASMRRCRQPTAKDCSELGAPGGPK